MPTANPNNPQAQPMVPAQPAPQPAQPLMQTPQQIHQQTAGQIQQVLKDVYGTEHNVIPTTAETPVEGDNPGDFIDRVIYNRPGMEPSKGFLKKMVERLKKKNPGAQIQYKEERK